MPKYFKRAISTMNQQRGMIYALLNENAPQLGLREENLYIMGFYKVIGFM